MQTNLLIYGIDFCRQSNCRLACVATYFGPILISTCGLGGHPRRHCRRHLRR